MLTRRPQAKTITLIAALVIVAVSTGGAFVYRHLNSRAASGWLSGGSCNVGDGGFASWRGEPVTIAGTWNDKNVASQKAAATMAGEYGGWSQNIDIAIGGVFRTAGDSWVAAARGDYDSRWKESLANINAGWGSKKTVFIRFAHEFNGDWFEWSVSQGENADFITAFRRFYGLVQSDLVAKGRAAKVVWSPNAAGHLMDTRQNWPGDAYVDVVGVDSYDWYETNYDQAAWDRNFNKTDSYSSPQGVNAWRTFAQSHGKPISFPEWGLSGEGPIDNPFYLQKMNAFFRSNAGSGPGQVWYEVLFDCGPAAGWGGQFQLYPVLSLPNSSATYQSLVWGDSGIVGTPGPTPTNSTPTPTPTPGQIVQTGNLLAKQPVVSSSDSTTEPGHPAAYVNDGDETTRWISNPVDNTTLTIDMGATKTLTKVSILWAGDTTHNYQLQMSADNTSWTTVATGITNNTTPQLINLTTFSAAPTGRYLRVLSLDRWNSSYGNSIWEIGAYGSTGSSVIGDIDGNAKVDVFDISILLSAWNTTATNADINHDGHVNIFDLSILLSHWTG